MVLAARGENEATVSALNTSISACGITENKARSEERPRYGGRQ